MTIRLKPATIASLDAEAAELRPQASRAALIESILEEHAAARAAAAAAAKPPPKKG